MSVAMVPRSDPVGPYLLPPLKFAYAALAPVIDAATVRLHHDKVHQSYVDQLNAALHGHPEWHGLTIEQLLARSMELPLDIRETVRTQGGGHANHHFFWKILTPGGAAQGPTGDLLAAIVQAFGSLASMKAQFEDRGARHFGAGWAFLVAHPRDNFRPEIITLPDEGSLLTLEEPSPGLLACDLWEHAYYLGYDNRRSDWLKAWWGIVNWPYVASRYAGIRAGERQL